VIQCWGSLVIRVLPRIPWHEVVCLKQSVNASHARGAPILRCSIPSPTGVRRRYSIGSPDTRRSVPHGWPPPQASSSPGHNPAPSGMDVWWACLVGVAARNTIRVAS